MSANDVVISGMSGRFALSDTTDELARNLYDGVDMVTEDDTRWPTGLYGMNSRFGKIMEFNKFDTSFFGLPDQMVMEMEPQARMVLEVAYEAIVDSGTNPQDLRGSNTGVYVGHVSIPGSEGYPDAVQPDSATSMTRIGYKTFGNVKCLLANRISFALDLHGPSMTVDTACSSASSAIIMALNDLMLGKVDSAVVCGSHMVFEPYVLHLQQELGMCSRRGMCSALDVDADGYVKGEAVCAVYMQRRHRARRVYAHLITARMSNDGHKREGMYYPSSEAQERLMVDTYTEANVDPAALTYFETHGAGTK
ncbi:unnamed protein product, partial [Oppiella nova]